MICGQENLKIMLAKNDVAKVYETVLSIPGMNDEIKVPLKITRKNLLLLSKVINRGLSGKETEDKSLSVLDIITKETFQELGEISSQLLHKAGLNELNDKLNELDRK